MTKKQNEDPSEEPANSDTQPFGEEFKPEKKKSVARAFGYVGEKIQSTARSALGYVDEKVKSAGNYISETYLFKKMESAWDYVSETHLFKIATSKAVSNVATIILTSLALAGVTASPFGPVVVGVLGGITLASVAIKVTVDLVQARSLRHLGKENNILVKNRDAKEQQVNILKDNPKLENILKDQLFQPEAKEGKKSVTQRLARDKSQAEFIAKGYAKAFLKQGLDIAVDIVNSTATAGIGLAIKIGGIAMSLFSLGTEAETKVTIDTIRHDLKKQIDSERDKADTPGYNNIKDLRVQVREQRIQTMALKELVNDKNYPSMSEEQIKAKFSEIKGKICASEKEIITSRNIFVRGARAVVSVIKDAARGQNPYSKFNNPEKIVINKPGMENQPEEQKKSYASKLSQIAARLTKKVSENIKTKSSSNVPPPMNLDNNENKSGKSR